MTAINPPSFTENSTLHHARGARLLATHGVLNSGVWASGDLVVTAAGGSMAVSVAAGGATVKGTTQTAQGSYACYNDAAVTKTLKVGGAGARVDLLVAQVHDGFVATPTNTDANGNYQMPAANTWDLVLIDGTTGAPAVPAAPANSYVLAQINVGAGVSTISGANVSDVRTMMVRQGQTATVVSTDATPSFTGQIRYETDTLDVVVKDSGGVSHIISDGGPWTSWTPVGTNWTFGTGATLSGRYRRSDAKTMQLQMYILMGTSPSFGAAASLSVPFAGVASQPIQIGSFLRRTAAGSYNTGVTTLLANGTDLRPLMDIGNAGGPLSGLSSGIAIAAGDSYTFEITYETV